MEYILEMTHIHFFPSFLFKNKLFLCYVHMYVYTIAGFRGSQKWVLVPVELELEAVVSLCGCLDSNPGQILIAGIFLVNMYRVSHLSLQPFFLSSLCIGSRYLKAHSTTVSRVASLPLSLDCL